MMPWRCRECTELTSLFGGIAAMVGLVAGSIWPRMTSSNAPPASKRLDELLELGTDLLCCPLQLCIVNGLHRCNRIDCRHLGPSATDILHHDIARKHCPNFV